MHFSSQLANFVEQLPQRFFVVRVVAVFPADLGFHGADGDG
ncbi:hypothetical protein [Saccharopolyspora sp. 5N708]